MKKLALSILAALVAMPLAASAAEANVYADVLSAYVYRGIVGNDEAVFQPGLDVSAPFGLGASLWGNMNLTDNDSSWYADTEGEWGELNVGLNWTCPGEGPVSLTLGGIYFIYPQESSAVETDETGAAVLDDEGLPVVSKAPADGRYEVSAKLSADDLPLQPSFGAYHGLKNTDDWILILGIGHGFELSDKLSLDLGASVGYAGEYYVEYNYGFSDAGELLTHAQIDAGLNYSLTEQTSIGLKASYSSILDGDLRDDIEENDSFPEVDVFYGGVTASYSF